MSTRISLNGEIFENVSISALDHGFLFGDSVYEVICTRKGRPCFANKHLMRLRNSAAAIFLIIPWTDERFLCEIQKTLDAAENRESYIRIVVTRGEGEIDIDPSTCRKSNVLIYVKPAKIYPPEEYATGISLALVSIKRNAKEALNPAIKTGNYLNNVLAKIEANRLGAKDAVMLNNGGQITESTTSNIFWVWEDRLRTPSLACGILSGITREIVLQLARENGILIEEGQWDAEELNSIDEAFLTGTVKKIMPISHLNGDAVGSGKPGPITRRLMELYDAILEKGS